MHANRLVAVWVSHAGPVAVREHEVEVLLYRVLKVGVFIQL